MKNRKRGSEDQLKKLLFNVYQKGNDGASLDEVMKVLKQELPKITQQLRIGVVLRFIFMILFIFISICPENIGVYFSDGKVIFKFLVVNDTSC